MFFLWTVQRWRSLCISNKGSPQAYGVYPFACPVGFLMLMEFTLLLWAQWLILSKCGTLQLISSNLFGPIRDLFNVWYTAVVKNAKVGGAVWKGWFSAWFLLTEGSSDKGINKTLQWLKKNSGLHRDLIILSRLTEKGHQERQKCLPAASHPNAESLGVIRSFLQNQIGQGTCHGRRKSLCNVMPQFMAQKFSGIGITGTLRKFQFTEFPLLPSVFYHQKNESFEMKSSLGCLSALE